ncbi:cysteine dioxygenase family protein [Caballeronia sp. LZ062]|uniref:cysteine dioxygenase family protein n=1 Tax=unclassified Caballeronia TaxID=2646786 RepID=UPI002857DCC1|nr:MULTISPECIES: cysteine dioxygenase family protein [unclassified Caballeronia]MDR5854116.1 cysteine dioxygenase family protein [Caballeronia sp. LZ050]MDR5871353.1 cysteine dioxygenase family protein [Caballeronia sp. LZ062]
MELELATQRNMPFPADPNVAVSRLCHEINAALDAAQADGGMSFGIRVHAALSRVIADPGLSRADQRSGSQQGYQRHLLAADPLGLGRFAIAALVWEPGQFSPVHAHRTWCGYAVIEGALAETLYRWDVDACRAVETRRHSREAGAVSYADAGRGAIHRLGNLADATARAVSIHVYGVASEHIATHVNDLLVA